MSAVDEMWADIHESTRRINAALDETRYYLDRIDRLKELQRLRDEQVKEWKRLWWRRPFTPRPTEYDGQILGLAFSMWAEYLMGKCPAMNEEKHDG